MLTETVAVKSQQTMAMTILFSAQLLELFGLLRITLSQPFREVIIDACVFFLE
jgi:hypothetical protein